MAKNIRFLTLFLFVFLIFHPRTASQPMMDSIQIERIAKFSQLWGHLKYFHPFLHHPTIIWERAFTNTVELVIQAETSEDYSKAGQGMFSHLNDPPNYPIKVRYCPCRYKATYG